MNTATEALVSHFANVKGISGALKELSDDELRALPLGLRDALVEYVGAETRVIKLVREAAGWKA